VACIIGTGAVWSNRNTLTIGNHGARSQLIISNGADVFCSTGIVGSVASSSNNTVLVTGSGSVWQNSGELDLGYAGCSNSLTVANSGAVLAPNMVVGVSAGSSLNLMTISGGSLTVTNAPGNRAVARSS
jgi:T5SS/PEP-CTERM-associated repeat protein